VRMSVKFYLLLIALHTLSILVHWVMWRWLRSIAPDFTLRHKKPILSAMVVLVLLPLGRELVAFTNRDLVRPLRELPQLLLRQAGEEADPCEPSRVHAAIMPATIDRHKWLPLSVRDGAGEWLSGHRA